MKIFLALDRYDPKYQFSTWLFRIAQNSAIDALRKAWDAGYKDAEWTRRDPDLTILHGDPDFERLYPAGKEEGKA